MQGCRSNNDATCADWGDLSLLFMHIWIRGESNNTTIIGGKNDDQKDMEQSL